MRIGWILGAVLAASAALAEEVSTFRLDNGMDVVVIEDHRAPAVVHMVWYRIGAADEPPGHAQPIRDASLLRVKPAEDLDHPGVARAPAQDRFEERHLKLDAAVLWLGHGWNGWRADEGRCRCRAMRRSVRSPEDAG